MSTEHAVAVIIGGASGIGWATAQQLAERGDTVIIADLDGDAATTRAAELGGRAGAQQVLWETAWPGPWRVRRVGNWEKVVKSRAAGVLPLVWEKKRVGALA